MDGKVNLWRVAQAASLGVRARESTAAQCLNFQSMDCVAHLYTVYNAMQGLPALKAPPTCMEFDCNEQSLVVGTEAGLIKVFDLSNLKGLCYGHAMLRVSAPIMLL